MDPVGVQGQLVFREVIFLTDFYHGIHHHFLPSFGECGALFSNHQKKQIQEDGFAFRNSICTAQQSETKTI